MDLTISGGMGGRDTVAALLAFDPKARVIVSSGYSNDPIMGEFKDYGFSAVLAKPYRLDELRAVLAAVVGHPGSGNASTPDSA
jgi:DNA-binding NarL/FixJ family response regulator